VDAGGSPANAGNGNTPPRQPPRTDLRRIDRDESDWEPAQGGRHAPSFIYGRVVPEEIFLIIEVADTSLAYDRRVKGKLYAESGIQEYWIVNLSRQCVEQYQLPGKEKYERRNIVTKDAMLKIPGFDVEISVGAMLG